MLSEQVGSWHGLGTHDLRALGGGYKLAVDRRQGLDGQLEPIADQSTHGGPAPNANPWVGPQLLLCSTQSGHPGSMARDLEEPHWKDRSASCLPACYMRQHRTTLALPGSTAAILSRTHTCVYPPPCIASLLASWVRCLSHPPPSPVGSNQLASAGLRP